MKATYSIVISLDHFWGFKQDLSSYRYNIRARKILVKNGSSPNGMIDVTKRSEEKRNASNKMLGEREGSRYLGIWIFSINSS